MLHIRIAPGALKYPCAEISLQANHMKISGDGIKASAFLKFSADFNVQPKLRAPGREQFDKNGELGLLMFAFCFLQPQGGSMTIQCTYRPVCFRDLEICISNAK